jgi:hypothetical protein
MFWIATAHGKGKIKACAGPVCTESRWEIDQ